MLVRRWGVALLLVLAATRPSVADAILRAWSARGK
jgi:hypothetical protein